jgi:cytochrome c peroxidase
VITGKPEDRRIHTTPTLRRLIVTWPDMHGGNSKSLEEVVDFYDRLWRTSPLILCL